MNLKFFTLKGPGAPDLIYIILLEKGTSRSRTYRSNKKIVNASKDITVPKIMLAFQNFW